MEYPFHPPARLFPCKNKVVKKRIPPVDIKDLSSPDLGDELHFISVCRYLGFCYKSFTKPEVYFVPFCLLLSNQRRKKKVSHIKSVGNLFLGNKLKLFSSCFQIKDILLLR